MQTSGGRTRMMTAYSFQSSLCDDMLHFEAMQWCCSTSTSRAPPAPVELLVHVLRDLVEGHMTGPLVHHLCSKQGRVRQVLYDPRVLRSSRTTTTPWEVWVLHLCYQTKCLRMTAHPANYQCHWMHAEACAGFNCMWLVFACPPGMLKSSSTNQCIDKDAACHPSGAQFGVVCWV